MSFQVGGSIDGVEDVEITKFDGEDSAVDENAVCDIDSPGDDVAVMV